MQFSAETLGFTVAVCSPSWHLYSGHSYTVTVSERGMTDTERSPLKPEHADRAGQGLLTAGMQQLEEQRANPSCQWVDGAVSTFPAGISAMQELPACLWDSLSPVVHCFHTGYLCLAVFSSRRKKKYWKGNPESLTRLKIVKGGQQDERGTPLCPGKNLASEASAHVVTNRTVQCSAISPSALLWFYLHLQIDQPGLGLPSRDYYECTGAYQEVRGSWHTAGDSSCLLPWIFKADTWLFKTFWKEINMKQFSFVIEPLPGFPAGSRAIPWLSELHLEIIEVVMISPVLSLQKGGHFWAVTNGQQLANAAGELFLPGIGLERKTEHSEPKRHFAAWKIWKDHSLLHPLLSINTAAKGCDTTERALIPETSCGLL